MDRRGVPPVFCRADSPLRVVDAVTVAANAGRVEHADVAGADDEQGWRGTERERED